MISKLLSLKKALSSSRLASCTIKPIDTYRIIPAAQRISSLCYITQLYGAHCSLTRTYILETSNLNVDVGNGRRKWISND